MMDCWQPTEGSGDAQFKHFHMLLQPFRVKTDEMISTLGRFDNITKFLFFIICSYSPSIVSFITEQTIFYL